MGCEAGGDLIMPKSKRKAIESGIQSKKKITFNYAGKKRTAEVHVLGESGGSLQVLAYTAEGWRRFDVGKMSSVKGSRGKFESRDDGAPYAPFDTVLKVVK